MSSFQQSSLQQSSQQQQQQQSSTSKVMQVKKNDKIRIDIQFKDGSKSDLTFKHNGKELKDEKEISIEFKNDIASLTIVNADLKHTGIYECIMKTEGGEARCSVQCQVVE